MESLVSAAASPELGFPAWLRITHFINIVAPMMILTGIATSPAVVGRFPWYAKLFGNRQSAG
jgi:hypothetical protein